LAYLAVELPNARKEKAERRDAPWLDRVVACVCGRREEHLRRAYRGDAVENARLPRSREHARFAVRRVQDCISSLVIDVSSANQRAAMISMPGCIAFAHVSGYLVKLCDSVWARESDRGCSFLHQLF
jgi:hypothetical protein